MALADEPCGPGGARERRDLPGRLPALPLPGRPRRHRHVEHERRALLPPRVSQPPPRWRPGPREQLRGAGLPAVLLGSAPPRLAGDPARRGREDVRPSLSGAPADPSAPGLRRGRPGGRRDHVEPLRGGRAPADVPVRAGQRGQPSRRLSRVARGGVQPPARDLRSVALPGGLGRALRHRGCLSPVAPSPDSGRRRRRGALPRRDGGREDTAVPARAAHCAGIPAPGQREELGAGCRGTGGHDRPRLGLRRPLSQRVRRLGVEGRGGAQSARMVPALDVLGSSRVSGTSRAALRSGVRSPRDGARVRPRARRDRRRGRRAAVAPPAPHGRALRLHLVLPRGGRARRHRLARPLAVVWRLQPAGPVPRGEPAAPRGSRGAGARPSPWTAGVGPHRSTLRDHPRLHGCHVGLAGLALPGRHRPVGAPARRLPPHRPGPGALPSDLHHARRRVGVGRRWARSS